MTPRFHFARRAARALTLCLALAAAGPGLAATAWADEPPLGTYELRGSRNDGRRYEAQLVVKRRPSGGLRVDRSAEDLEVPVTRRQTVRWRSLEVRQAGRELRVVYTLPAFRNAVGAAGRIRGLQGIDPPRNNRIEATYRIDPEGRIREVLTNATRLAPETEWTHATAQGAREGALRLRLGYREQLPSAGSLELILPCAGTLLVEGEVRLHDAQGGALPSGPRVPGQARGSARYPAQRGRYTIRGAAGAQVRALLLQEAQLAGTDAEPWDAPSYYPLFEFERDGARNLNTLYVHDGPLARFDRAFALRAPQSAVAWERGESGPGRRIGLPLEDGHYFRKPVIRESHAETDFGVDIDGDGRIGGSRDEVFRGLDRDRDGQVTPREVEASVEGRLRDALYALYDFDRDGRIEVGLEVSPQDAAPFDRDRDGVLSPAELLAAMRSAGPVGREAEHYRSQWRDALLAGAQGRDQVRLHELRPGGWDFVDDEDQDGDGVRDFERWNLIVHLSGGSSRVASSVHYEGPWAYLETRNLGAKRVEQIPRSAITAQRWGADGDLDDEYHAEWWGHCNGAALAGILFEEPREALTFRGVRFEPEHLKGLLCEFALGQTDLRGFAWEDPTRPGRHRSPSSYAQGFHETLRTLDPQALSFMIDAELKAMGAGGEVWNYALTGYALELREAPGGDPQVLEVSGRLSHLGGARALRYRLEFDPAGKVEGEGSRTTWLVRKGSPVGLGEGADPQSLRYFRYVTAPQRVRNHNRRANPHVSAERLSELFGGRLPYRAAVAR